MSLSINILNKFMTLFSFSTKIKQIVSVKFNVGFDAILYTVTSYEDGQYGEYGPVLHFRGL